MDEEPLEGTELFCVRARLPASGCAGFGAALLEWTQGAATAPLLAPAGFDVLEVDPFWSPSTEDEREEHGDLAVSVFAASNPARALVNAVRRRKGLALDERVLAKNAEAQKGNARIKA